MKHCKHFLHIGLIFLLFLLSSCGVNLTQLSPQVPLQPPVQSALSSTPDTSLATGSVVGESSLPAPSSTLEGFRASSVDGLLSYMLGEVAEGPEFVDFISEGEREGVLGDKYGKHGAQKDALDIPTLSLPVTIIDAPKEAACFAIIMHDQDAEPLQDYERIHWLAANIETSQIPENASIEMADQMVQGLNSYGTIGYGGPCPMDKPHTYVVTVVALSARLELGNGFDIEDFAEAAAQHILCATQLQLKYSD